MRPRYICTGKRSFIFPVFIGTLALFACGCSSLHKYRTTEGKEASSKTVIAARYTLTETASGYKEDVKTVTLACAVKKTYRCEGVLVRKKKIRYVSYNPLYEILEIPEGAVELAFMPIVLGLGLCTGHYAAELDKAGAWESTIRPTLLKLNPFMNNRYSLLGKRELTQEVLETTRTPTEPWTENETTDLEDAEILSVKPAQGNRLSIEVVSFKKNAGGSVTLSIKVSNPNPGVPFVADCRLLIKMKTAEGEKEIEYTTEYNQFLQEF